MREAGPIGRQPLILGEERRKEIHGLNSPFRAPHTRPAAGTRRFPSPLPIHRGEEKGPPGKGLGLARMPQGQLDVRYICLRGPADVRLFLPLPGLRNVGTVFQPLAGPVHPRGLPLCPIDSPSGPLWTPGPGPALPSQGSWLPPNSSLATCTESHIAHPHPRVDTQHSVALLLGRVLLLQGGCPSPPPSPRAEAPSIPSALRTWSIGEQTWSSVWWLSSHFCGGWFPG